MWFARIKCLADAMNLGARLFFRDVDRHLRAVGLREPRLVLEARRHRAVADFMGVTEFVEIEQFWRQRLAARMALAFVLVDADPELSGHHERSLLPRAAGVARFCVPSRRRVAIAHPSLSYNILLRSTVALSSGKL